eukprot:m.34049 g.34049  ORF g.34049 m.34049 type:complete len:110 (-) comp12270_c0_seq2:957-1286(-)
MMIKDIVKAVLVRLLADLDIQAATAAFVQQLNTEIAKGTARAATLRFLERHPTFLDAVLVNATALRLKLSEPQFRSWISRHDFDSSSTTKSALCYACLMAAISSKRIAE